MHARSFYEAMSNQIFAETDKYINDLFAPEDDVLKAIEPSLHRINSSMAEGSVSAGQGKFLQLMAHMCGAKRILELGTLGGYSTIWLARALQEKGRLITIELNEDHAALARRHIATAGLTHKVDVRVGKCIDILESMIKGNEPSFDLVFMDADKPPYAEYFQLILKLSRPGTIIIADNVIREGKVLDVQNPDPAVQGVLRFNKMLAGEPRVIASVIQTIGIKAHDGMAIAIVR
jgi:predicted O-methyltransferase YrrM